LIKLFVYIICLATFVASQTAAPEPKVGGNAIVSAHDAKVRVQLPDSSAARHSTGGRRSNGICWNTPRKKITIQQNPDTPLTCHLSILLWIRA
jgi:hypothetical protein